MIAAEDTVMWTLEWPPIAQLAQTNSSLEEVIVMNAIVAIDEIPLGGEFTFCMGNDRISTLLMAMSEAVASGEANSLWSEMWDALQGRFVRREVINEEGFPDMHEVAAMAP
jgi:hypothetical protein